MDKELFEQLHQSMKEAVAIAKGNMPPSRVFTVETQSTQKRDIVEVVSYLQDHRRRQ